MQFDHFANSYEDYAFIQKDLITWGLDWINRTPITNVPIIEFGAGTGLLTQHLVKRQAAQILATDLSPKMIEEGKLRVPEADWAIMNAWDSSPNDVEHIFSSSLLQWCPNPQETISKWALHLNKGGTIHALLFIGETLKELRQLAPLDDIIQWRTLKTWEGFFKNAGLRVLGTREFMKTYGFSSSLDLIKTLKYTGTGLRNQLCGGQLRQLLKKYEERYHYKQGVISSWQFCQIIGQK